MFVVMTEGKENIKMNPVNCVSKLMIRLIVFPVITLLALLSFGKTSFASGQVTLTWTAPTTNADGTPLTDLAGYKVYYGTESGNYSNMVDIGMSDCREVDGSTECSYVIVDLVDNVYYFAVTAYDTSGNESNYSNEVKKAVGIDTDNDGIPDKIDNCRLTANSGQQDTDNDGYGNMCDADLDNDGFVGIFDFNIFRMAWLSNPSSPNWNADADFDSDGVVGVFDFNIFKTRWLISAPYQ